MLKSVVKEWLHAMKFVLSSDKEIYGSLFDGLHNNHNAGAKKYPEKLTAAYHLRINFKEHKDVPNILKAEYQYDYGEGSRDDRYSGLAFAQQDDGSSFSM